MPFRALRASKAFTVFVVCVGVFSDVLLQNLVVPVLPYALKERVGLADEADVQWWNSLLLASFGGAFMLGSRTCGLDRSVLSLLLTMLTLLVGLRVDFLMDISPLSLSSSSPSCQLGVTASLRLFAIFSLPSIPLLRPALCLRAFWCIDMLHH